MGYYGKELPTCRACGASITFVKTEAGKNMPCETMGFWVLPKAEGQVFYTPEGKRILGKVVDKSIKGAVIAFLPHWGNCTSVGKRRRKPDDLSERIRAQVARERTARERQAERRREKEAQEREMQEALDAQTCIFPQRL